MIINIRSKRSVRILGYSIRQLWIALAWVGFLCLLARVPIRADAEKEKADITFPVTPQGKYSFLSTPYSEEDAPQIQDALPIDSIEMRLWGPPDLLKLEAGVEFCIRLEKSGRAEYHGISQVENLGRHRGVLSLSEYGKLCLLFELMESNHPDVPFGIAPQLSNPVVVELKVLKTGQDKPTVFRDDANFGDYRFWTFRTALEGVASKIRWDQIEEE